ncbi:ABC transporter permease [Micromonospora olivasterospora]|uniref:Mannose ABC transporter membrane protein /fructose ABC transporter membrane protein /ribose ABC transporter membrane protein n=1 Tax=Micromonospora olivasterospora TaxID=1880 RepID=A0A562I815_MICOL|nr:ABC transporter permease [Micromonospora olivasterospora]TWH67160.1 mannose ABC transporter membrane protein /fructose ABC transporter membrane protein /ribose ABC transporter membrane protein [Micromonospora olivasterospora]
MTNTVPPPTAAPDLSSAFLDRSTPLSRVRDLLHRHPAISPAVVLVVSVLVFGLLNDRFLAPANLSLITQQVAVVGTLAIAQTLVILTAGIDLSVGAAMILAAMVMAQSASSTGVPPTLSLVLGLLAGTAAGGLNGLLVTRLKLPPFIVTLGTLSIFTALTLLYTSGNTVRGSQLSDTLTLTGNTLPVLGIKVSVGVLIMLALYILIAYVLNRTAWGRHVYAVGDDKEAARLSGIRVDRVLASVYLVAGAIIAVTAWIQIGRTNAASPNSGIDLNLDSITAVVIGGTSLFGGRGAIWGTLLGALIVGVFRNGLALAGLDVLYQTLTVGVLVIVAVAVDQWIRKAKS